MENIYTKYKLYIEEKKINKKEDINNFLFNKKSQKSKVKKADLGNNYIEVESYNNIYYLSINNIIDLQYKILKSSSNDILELLYISYTDLLEFVNEDNLETCKNCDFILCDEDVYLFLEGIKKQNSFNLSDVNKQIEEGKKQMY